MEIEIFKSLDIYFQDNRHQRQLETVVNEIRNKGVFLFDRACLPYHFTASAWVVDRERENALLIFHRKLQIWIQPGGHADRETNLSAVAFKEAKEETGLTSLKLISNKIFDFDITPIPPHKETPAHSHLDVRYLIEADMGEQILESNETAGAKWLPITLIFDETKDPGILRMAKRMLDYSDNI